MVVLHSLSQASRTIMQRLSFSHACYWALQYFYMHYSGPFRAIGWLTSLLSMQWLSWTHLKRSEAAWLPFLARQVDQQALLFWHSFEQSAKAGKHFPSFSQALSWSGQCSAMHSWGVRRAKELISGTYPRQLFFWAHLATSMAAWLPFDGRQRVQQDTLVPHFFWQS